MNESELRAAEVIALNVELLESAYDFAVDKMDAALYSAVRDIMDEKTKELGWDGELGESFEDMMWLAPPEWRAIERKKDADNHLYCFLDIADGANTWLAHFAGGDERSVLFNPS